MKIDLIATAKNKHHREGARFSESRYMAKALVALGSATYDNKALVSSPVVKEVIVPSLPVAPAVIVAPTIEPEPVVDVKPAEDAPVPALPGAPPLPAVPKTRQTRKPAVVKEDEK